MSSRNKEYERFLDAWKEWTNSVDDVKISTDGSESVNVKQEIARLLKAIAYLDKSVMSIDRDLVPLSLWTECANYCISYKPNIEAAITSQTEASIIPANANIDNLLVILSPYIQDNLSTLKALKPAFNTHLKHISKELEAYDEKSSALVKELEDKRGQSTEAYDEILTYKDSISKLYTEFLIGIDEQPSLQDKLQELETTIDAQYTKINEFYQTLVTNEDSIKSKVDTAQELVIDSSIKIKNYLTDFSDKLDELSNFHKKIFGEPDDKGNIENGLKFEFSERREELTLLKSMQDEQYNAMKKNIESLLPGATSAGLASAYHDLSESFINPIRIYTVLFSLSIVILLGLALYFTNQNTILTDTTTDITIVKDIGIFLLQRLPIILPVIWFAVFSSKRRSEAERLKQEYAHKEALAKSYQSFKNQIEALDEERQEPLLEKLLAATIDTIAANASNTLDKRHGDNAPLFGVLDKTIDRLPSIKSEK